MEISDFKSDDLWEINGWYEKRGLPKMTPGAIPQIGFIVRGIASVFVYLTDSSICIIEGLVSNPDTDKTVRRETIRALVSHAYDQARRHRDLVVVIVKNGWVKDLAKNTGYVSLGSHELFIKG